MSQAGANTPANHFGGSFGPNEWLVQEMYERYQTDLPPDHIYIEA